MWTHAKSIKVIDRADGKAKVYILARRDGFYEYIGEAEIQADQYERVYWSPTEMPGLFACQRLLQPECALAGCLGFRGFTTALNAVRLIKMTCCQ
jgi:hypothetical protein